MKLELPSTNTPRNKSSNKLSSDVELYCRYNNNVLPRTRTESVMTPVSLSQHDQAEAATTSECEKIFDQDKKPQSGSSPVLTLTKLKSTSNTNSQNGTTTTKMDIPMTFLLFDDCLDKGMGFLKYTHYGDLVNITEEQLRAQVPAQYFAATPCLAMDCEMVGVGPRCDSVLARVSIVNEHGYCLYDKFVKPVEKVTDYRTAKSGIHKNDLVERGQPRSVVLKEVKNILTGHKLIGHSVHNDLEVLDYEHPKEKTRDTADYFKSLSNSTNSLKALTKQYLKVDIQGGEHSSIQDAQATMKLYLLHRVAWENELKTRNRQARSPDDIKTITCYPRKYDLFMNSNEVFLRKNKIGTAFHSASEYLDIQFRLLREDFMRPLRLGVKDARAQLSNANPNTSNKKKICTPNTVRLFTNVTVRKSCQGELKGFSQLHIPVEENKLNLIDWEESKCFMHGSLVILSYDNFQSVKLATVFRIEDDKKQSTLRQGLLNIQCIKDGPTWKLQDGMTFQMVESVAFFEAYTHSLQCLQLMNLDTFPLAKYIVNGVTKPGIIKYPANMQDIDFSGAFDSKLNGTKALTKLKLANINDTATWPPATQFGFNPSQYEAFKAALTQELAIIQGPPGTGKTFLGVQLMKVLLSNVHLLESPILVIAQTNHALDNILEPVLEFARKITGSESRGNNLMLRVGGGSKSNEISKVTLKAKQAAINFKKLVKKALPHAETGIAAAESLIKRQLQASHAKTFNDVADEVSKIQKFLSKTEFLYADEESDKLHNKHDRMISKLDNALVALGKKAPPKKKIAPKKKQDSKKGMLETALENMMGVKPKIVIMSPTKPLTPINPIEAKNRAVSEIQASIKNWMEDLQKRNKLLQSKWSELTDVTPEFMDKVKVIGMTATGAAKHKDRVIHKFFPEIMIVEEAAHVLESHVVAALTAQCKHLILIGDHQQLRPSTADYHLTQNYGMDVSLMERLVENGKAQGNKNWVQLNVQHRMRPEIAQLVSPVIYKVLNNHESVTKFPDVKGVTKNMFFLDHRNPDKREDESPSHFNEYEACLTAKLCQYFIGQGYEGSKISIITTYMGQRNLLQKKLRGDASCKEVRICCVDGFQGEENDIILLSLVRSNKANSIGFLSTNNRVCVALSRARHGCFIIGNMEGLASQSKTWAEINKTLIRSGAIGEYLSLHCKQHGKTTKVSKGSDFDNLHSCGCPGSGFRKNQPKQKPKVFLPIHNHQSEQRARGKVIATKALQQAMASFGKQVGTKGIGYTNTNGHTVQKPKPKKVGTPSKAYVPLVLPAKPVPILKNGVINFPKAKPSGKA